jgi:hypothetical protein
MRMLEKELYEWPDVTRTRNGDMANYFVHKRHFASASPEYLILLRLNEEDKQLLRDMWQAEPRVIGGKTIGFELQVPLDERNVTELMAYIRKSYDHALTWKGV